MKYYKDKDFNNKKTKLYADLCELLYSLNYKDQIEFIYDLKRDLDLLEKQIEIQSLLNLGGRKFVNTINLEHSVYVSDPCYTTNVWCLAKIDNILPGKYSCFRTIIKDEDWGLRVSEILVVHENYLTDNNSIDKLTYEHLDEYTIGVDSGQCGIFDSEYYEINHNSYNEELCEDWYNKVCNITLENFGGTIDNLGIVSSSGYGDGSYPLYVSKNNDGKIISLKVIFINNKTSEELKEDIDKI